MVFRYAACAMALSLTCGPSLANDMKIKPITVLALYEPQGGLGTVECGVFGGQSRTITFKSAYLYFYTQMPTRIFLHVESEDKPTYGDYLLGLDDTCQFKMARSTTPK